ncbi:MAG TPA: sodium:solute symporter [Flavobacteriales bacterium]|jgi:SSS family solute:Na+ symporter|nr:sodium:solute symporter [Flavobacteriales bacterium]MBK7102054.1 sodium:solute symporter [Flavobacteriales bacterium]MBK7114405.1 sodium:solute symporter [Flavobacteriales bacterium]MBK7483535.1 sodium:solute symporter [Flavobacteriales bacterium]MBK7620911.1 sodium:solute symporter [Flavobacteriales bacterium]
MHLIDWLILLGTLGFIVGYGVWKTRKDATSDSFLKGGSDNRWWAVGLSVMATQASAITFLSTPGQGFLDGMGFIQFYFGLPLAMLVIGFVFIPLYYKWKVYTAYEFIGKRFDGRTRLLTAGLFLIQRSLAAGITIYAPSIILSKVLHWPLAWTCVFIGALVIIYTTSGGAKAVGVTHKQQMAVMFLGIFAAFGFTVYYLSDHASFGESIALAGALGKMNIVDTSWDPTTKYTLWSGLIGGFFLQLSYFGTDQSQVQRYLGGKDVKQARQGLWMNAALKIPMQFFILLTGVLVFVFYLFNQAPVHWNSSNMESIQEVAKEDTKVFWQLNSLDHVHLDNENSLSMDADSLVLSWRKGDHHAATSYLNEIDEGLWRRQVFRDSLKTYLHEALPDREANDKDYIFITFIMDHLPIGIVGLLLAMIFSAGMSSTSAELSALATTSVVDVVRKERSDGQQVLATRWATVLFGVMALLFAAVFSLFENLIQAVNILGSLFYGTILGIFLVAFFVKRVQGTAVFIAALIAQAIILFIHFSNIEIAFLWYNLIAPAIVVVLAILIEVLKPSGPNGRGRSQPA